MYQHLTTRHSFLIHAPATTAFPMFGPEGERVWAGPDWDPQICWTPFVDGERPGDGEGMIFTLGNGSTWINVRFDAEAGVAEYVHLLAGVVTRIRVEIRSREADSCEALVTYSWTATSPETEATIRERAATTTASLPTWGEKVNNALHT